jgi:cysteinyl-tRNA synthetase
MTIKFFNSSNKIYEEFQPNKVIKIYCCGPTIYDNIHIGNSRPIIIFDSLCCFLKNYYKNDNIKIKYIRNITDIDEKIINKVINNNIKYQDFIDNQINNFLNLTEYIQDFSPKNVRVTDYIDDIIQFIQQLIIKGYAYISTNNNVYFNTKKCPIYQCLSGNRENIESITVENESDKLHWQDFALWKNIESQLNFHEIPIINNNNKIFQTNNHIFWNSPWGYGIPGWHIECSTIINKELGCDIDIHGGGQDLIFPHHDNEIAQNWGLNNNLFCKYWLHNGMVLINGKKMAKSTGNFIQLKDIIYDKESGYILKYLMLSTHYKQPLNFTQDKWNNSKNNIEKIKTFIINNKNFFNQQDYQEFLKKDLKYLLQDITNDFNTVNGLNNIHYWIKQFKINKNFQQFNSQEIFFNVLFLLNSLGLNFYNLLI